jgi:hypothetical protein
MEKVVTVPRFEVSATLELDRLMAASPSCLDR